MIVHGELYRVFFFLIDWIEVQVEFVRARFWPRRYSLILTDDRVCWHVRQLKLAALHLTLAVCGHSHGRIELYDSLLLFTVAYQSRYILVQLSATAFEVNVFHYLSN